MKATQLVPRTNSRFRFTLRYQKFIPKSAGCYVLSTFENEILYIGLTDNLQRRFGEHRGSKEKTISTLKGAAFWFHFLACTEKDLQRLERTWLNQYEVQHGSFPVLNKVRSPVR
jgi:predicted GIY-YIG superfamily endonuclease